MVRHGSETSEKRGVDHLLIVSIFAQCRSGCTRESFIEGYFQKRRVGRQDVTAMRPYSMDLRERIAAAVDHHEGSIRRIARTVRVSTSFIVRLLQRRRAAGTLAPRPTGAVRPRPWGRTTTSGSPT